MAGKKFEPVYGTMIRLAVATGLRRGELIALRWKDVNLSERVAHISRSYNVLDEETTTKTDKARDVQLIEDAGLAILEEWVTEVGVQDDEALVFTSPRGDGYVHGLYLTKKLYAAMDDAGIPRLGERGVKRDFHSLRHTYDGWSERAVS